jgi:hypothetical protein
MDLPPHTSIFLNLRLDVSDFVGILRAVATRLCARRVVIRSHHFTFKLGQVECTTEEEPSMAETPDLAVDTPISLVPHELSPLSGGVPV